MKFTVTFKDPDTLGDAIRDAVIKDVATMGLLSTDEADAVTDLRIEKVGAACERWFTYGEYVSIEVDTDAGTAIVLGRSTES